MTWASNDEPRRFSGRHPSTGTPADAQWQALFARLVEYIADNRRFLPTYNNVAARSGLPLWPNDLAHAFGLVGT